MTGPEHVDTQPYERPYACREYAIDREGTPGAHCVLEPGHDGMHRDIRDQPFHVHYPRR